MTPTMTTTVTAWIRRRHHMELAGFPEWQDQHPRIRRLYTLWNHRFPHCDWHTFREKLAIIAENHSATPRHDDWTTTQSEWVAPIDDDDWHLPGLAEALADVPADFMMVCWPVIFVNLLSSPSVTVPPLHYTTGPESCAYAVRRTYLERLTPRQLALIRDDHRHVHRYIDFSGHCYLFLDRPFAVYLWTPASVSSLTDDADHLSLADAAAYAAIQPHCPPGAADAAALLHRLLAG